MQLDHVLIVFNVIVFLFAISVHESAHAWMANRRGDPTAKMLGRITLNPIRHIDPIGTILLPAIGMITGAPVLGWAKPVPVDPRNFKNEVLDDILTSAVGPVSNFVVAAGAVLTLGLIGVSSQGARAAIIATLQGSEVNSIIAPITLLLVAAIQLNVLLAVFNLFPVPPLDGSHVIRHFLPDGVREVFDRMGIILLIALVAFGGPVIRAVMIPFLNFFFRMLSAVLGLR